MFRALTISVAAALGGAAFAAAQADVAGSWALVISDPLGRDNQVALTLEQDGETLTGVADNSVVQSTVEGALDGGDIKMFYEVDTGQVGVITLAFSGTVDGSSMKGTVAFGRYGSGNWTAVRND